MPKSDTTKPLSLVIGICGATCAGKTTTANELCRRIPGSRVFSQDDYFLDVDDPRHIWIPDLDHINFDVVSSLDMEKMHNDISDYIDTIPRDRAMNVVIVEGFSIFNYPPMLYLFDLKYYFTLNETECLRRRLTRVYEPPDCPGYFEKCAWPEHLKQKEEVMSTVEQVTYFDENSKDVLGRILEDVEKFKENLNKYG